ncbi:hypothetical protein JCM11641_000749 [Rhodosporidiobolus odoratus]
MEECTSQPDPDYDLFFADDAQATNAASLKFLEPAAQWKKKQAAAAEAAPGMPAVQAEEPEGINEDDRLAEQEYQAMSSTAKQNPSNVLLLLFPRCKCQIWTSSQLLAISPYFETLFASSSPK